MSEKKKRNTAPVVVGNVYHEAMDRYFRKVGVPKRYQVEFALKEYFKNNAPEIYTILINKEKKNEKES